MDRRGAPLRRRRQCAPPQRQSVRSGEASTELALWLLHHAEVPVEHRCLDRAPGEQSATRGSLGRATMVHGFPDTSTAPVPVRDQSCAGPARPGRHARVSAARSKILPGIGRSPGRESRRTERRERVGCPLLAVCEGKSGLPTVRVRWCSVHRRASIQRSVASAGLASALARLPSRRSVSRASAARAGPSASVG